VIEKVNFPVHESDLKTPGCPRHVPWAVLAPHEHQALSNHSQSLVRLAERGGLSLCEMAAVIEERRWEKMTPEAALAVVTRAIEVSRGAP
jgi:hypothetical protein